MVAAILFLIGLVGMIVSLVLNTGWLYAGWFTAAVIIGIVMIFLIKPTLFDHLDQGRFKDANIFMIIWGILGLFVLVLPGLLILIGFVKLQDVFSPQYGQYQSQPGQVAHQPSPPAQYPAPPPAAPAPPAPEQAPTESAAKVDMVKCKKCNVQYPSFMHHCPNCNEPR